MRRRKYLIGMGSLATGTAAAVGSGAFRQATAQREFELTIEQDTQSPYLNFVPNSPYAEYENNVFKLSFRENAQGGKGIPSRANTWFESVFEIENLGTDDVWVWAPSFLSNQDPTSAAGAASTNFLVNKTGTGYKYDSGGSGCSAISPVNVDYVDISWPVTIGADKKPSNPVPEIGTGTNCTGQVLSSYKGVRYPGGFIEIGAGEKQPIDVRFTVSNLRKPGDNLDEIFDTSFYIKANKNQPSNTSDWKL